MKTAKECSSFLRQYNRWRRGRGKKYATPGIPFSVVELGETIDRAIEILKAIPKPEDLDPPNNRRIKKFLSVLNCNEQAQ